MKKLLCLLLSAAMLLAGGCAKNTSASQDAALETMTVYLISSDTAPSGSDLVQSRQLALPSGMYAGIDAALALLAAKPDDDTLRSPLPQDTAVETWTLEAGVVTLTMPDSFAAYSPMDQTVCAFCATLTLCELDEVDAVTVICGGQVLFQGLVPEDALLRDTDTDPYTKQLRLYFADADGRYLVSEYHSLTVDEDTPLERYVVEELLRGPNNTELHSAIPAGTELLGCSTENGVCTVDLSAAFLENRPDTALGERLAVYSLVNSLTALSTVDRVILLSEGQSIQTYVWRDLSGALSRYEAAIGPVSTAKGELDANLYRVLPGLAEMAAMPCAVETGEWSGEAQSVLAALLETQEPGYPALFTGMNAVTDFLLEGRLCTIDVTESFFASIASADERLMAVRSVAATLCSLSQIRSVRFSIGGSDAVFDGVDYSGPWIIDESIIVE